ncbi:sulfur carrier protein ThiS [Fredinandcohnia quinoae]|uniref:Sulfur carrier protein ThiS n=1 Tax=Fredinandcohnia quinoae TaxID=2918902 RepID=A0AAW5E2E3_9BACI|nr:sulfur carrier protein ThiS [Fredinandcohnia sp. SECRCQ15]MCH1627077.1 sulfur carrier protein ThiS [Fredinandcohnia sp. SECRCQ15]
MQLIINSDKIDIPNQIRNVTGLLEHFDLKQKVVIVEVNGVILEKVNHQDTQLSDGDRIEIVHFVGGG